MDKLSGAEMAAEVAALKALVLTLAQLVSADQSKERFKTDLINDAIAILQQPTTWNAPKNPTEELKERARSRCAQIVNSL